MGSRVICSSGNRLRRAIAFGNSNELDRPAVFVALVRQSLGGAQAAQLALACGAAPVFQESSRMIGLHGKGAFFGRSRAYCR
jgi:hypothetical protein